jgi:hypothetical protein
VDLAFDVIHRRSRSHNASVESGCEATVDTGLLV